jgi:glucose-1-phosphate cytidylyltransferase
MTYGDGLSSVDITASIAFHRKHGKLATVTAINPPGRFGVLSLSESETHVRQIHEKPSQSGNYINGGYFVLEPSALETIDNDSSSWEREPMERLSSRGQLMAFVHKGFWQPMDTLREKRYLEELWQGGTAEWKKW